MEEPQMGVGMWWRPLEWLLKQLVDWKIQSNLLDVAGVVAGVHVDWHLWHRRPLFWLFPFKGSRITRLVVVLIKRYAA